MVLHHFQPLHLTFLQTSNVREKELANGVSVRKQILSSMSVHEGSLENISFSVRLSNIFTDK